LLNAASDDDGEANTYDYNDSFLDDGTQRTKHSDDASATPSEEDDEEDLKSLKKEAKKFMKNKKLRQK
jgi:aprataxin and PNK-like factor